MIKFGSKVKRYTREIKGTVEVVEGYYLVLSNDDRIWFSETVDESALEKVCDKYLTDTDYNYWIEYCHGVDVHGRLAWSNLDHTDKFI